MACKRPIFRLLNVRLTAYFASSITLFRDATRRFCSFAPELAQSLFANDSRDLLSHRVEGIFKY